MSNLQYELIALIPRKCEGCWRALTAVGDTVQDVRDEKLTEDKARDRFSALGERCVRGMSVNQMNQERLCGNPELWLSQTAPLAEE